MLSGEKIIYLPYHPFRDFIKFHKMTFAAGDICVSSVMVLKNSFPEITKIPHLTDFVLLVTAFRAGVS